jgi:leucyl-tRNA synthetase
MAASGAEPRSAPRVLLVESNLAEAQIYQEEIKNMIQRGANEDELKEKYVIYGERQGVLGREVKALMIEEGKAMRSITKAMAFLQQTAAKKTVKMAEKGGVEAGMTYKLHRGLVHRQRECQG